MIFPIEQVIEWNRLNIEGMSCKEIGKIYNLNNQIINRWLNKYNFEVINHNHRSDGTIKEIHDYYMSDKKISLSETAVKFSCDLSRLQERFIKNKLEIKNYSPNANHPNHDFFKNIKSEEQAYLLGFFASDGHIETRKDYNSYTLRWMLHSKDIELLDIINKYIGNDNYSIYKSKTREVCSIAITSKQIGEDLNKLGYTSHKTKDCNFIPNIDKEFMRHFIRGFFDGDGCMSVTVDKNKNINRYFSISAYNENLLMQIFNYLDMYVEPIKIFTKKTFLNSKNESECWTYRTHHRESLGKIYHYFYDNSSLYLKRKKYKFDLCLKTSSEIRSALNSNI